MIARQKLVVYTVTLLLYVYICIPTAQALEKLTVILDWYINADHAPLFVAQQQGFFAQEGLDINFISPSDPAEPPRAVATNNADIGITYEPHFLIQVDHGLPLLRIGTLIDKPLNCILTLTRNGITSPADLKGKNIGYSSNDISSRILLTQLLKKYGLHSKDTQQIYVKYNLTQALLAGKVAAITGVMRNYEITQLKLAHYGVRAFYPEETTMPTYSELIFVTHKKNKNDPRLIKFMRALQHGVRYLNRYPQHSWEKFSQLHPELNNQLNEKTWYFTLPYFAKQPMAWKLNEWQQFADFMYANGLTQRPVNLRDNVLNFKGN